MKIKHLVVVTLLTASILLAGCAPATTTVYTQTEPPMRTITVTGTGMITLTPDIAYVYIGVRTQDASAAEAMSLNNTRAQAVIDAIKGFGVEDRDIQTTNFSIYPQPVYDDNYNQIGVTYLVDNTVYVTVRALDQLGELLDASLRAGANTINSISFDVADKTEVISQARLEAVQNARAQADELATASGVSVGDVQTISYYDSTPTPRYYEVRSADMANAAPSVPIEAGSMQVTTTVTIVYSIK